MSIDSRLDDYIAAHSSPEGDYLYRLYRATNVEIINPHMASGQVQGRLLKLLVQMIRPKRILEIGTYTGYSAICMAEGLGSDGKLFTFAINGQTGKIAGDLPMDKGAFWTWLLVISSSTACTTSPPSAVWL